MQQRAVWCAPAAVVAILWVVAIPVLPANLSTAFQVDDRRAAQRGGTYPYLPALSRRTHRWYAAAVDRLCCDPADPTNAAFVVDLKAWAAISDRLYIWGG